VNYEDTSLQNHCDRISGTFGLYTLLIVVVVVAFIQSGGHNTK